MQGIAGIDYRVKRRSLIEDIMDLEFDKFSDTTGYLYPDPDGNIFSNVFFHASELTLTLFDLLLFLSLDLIFGNFLLDVLIVYLVSKVCLSLADSSALVYITIVKHICSK